MLDQTKATPLLAQYFEIKEKHPNTIMLFQVGDFFELFFEDAKTVSQALCITLTKRGKHNGQDIPICGVPVSSLLHHLTKLVKQGFKVAVCEQISKPVPGEIVQRRVTRVLTPGTLTDDLMLDEKKNSFLCSLWPEDDEWGLIFTELLTAKVFATKIPKDQPRSLESELTRFFPDEILLPNFGQNRELQQTLAKNGFSATLTNPISSDNLSPSPLTETASFSFEQNPQLNNYLKTKLSSNIFSPLLDKKSLEGSLALLTSYLHAYHDNFLPLVEKINIYQPDDYLIVDSITLKNLEVVRNNYDGSSKHTLFAAIDKCMTAMGSRMLKQNLVFPLKNLTLLGSRTSFVKGLMSSFINLSQLKDLLMPLCDVERIVGRIALNRASLNDYLLLKHGLQATSNIKVFLQKNFIDLQLAFELINILPDLPGLQSLLAVSLEDNSLSDRKIKPGFDGELDAVRDFIGNTQQEIIKLELEEITRTKINNLKIKYTDISGYFFEINSSNLPLAPKDYKLQQSLVGRSRFVNDTLKALEYKINNAHQDQQQLEDSVFNLVKSQVYNYLSQLRMISYSLGQIDMLFSFAKQAYDYNYCQPIFVEKKDSLKITAGRHPVIEQCLYTNFVPNDTNLNEQERLMIITGPNMGGKSTYLRQVAHIALLAHTGSFVPATNCELSIIDRIFTRIGSGDNLAAGKSTFLIEMEEVAIICEQATKNSLIILDEVGRGTSTFDGMAIAQAILEFLLNQIKSKSLFATHYHELTDLTEHNPSAVNFHMSCRENNDTLIFSHHLMPGDAKSSFGIAVAKLAGISNDILDRAKFLLQEFKDGSHNSTTTKKQVFFEAAMTEPCLEKLTKLQSLSTKLRSLDLDDVSFKQAHEILVELQKNA